MYGDAALGESSFGEGVGGADLFSVLLDAGAIVVAGVDLIVSTAGVVGLDAGAIVVAGADLIIVAAGPVGLDTGAIVVAGFDLIMPSEFAAEAMLIYVVELELGQF